MRAAAYVVLAVLLVVCPACGGADPTNSPSAAVIAFADALREGRDEDAYALMSEEYRQRVSLREFKRRLRDHPEETEEVVASLALSEDMVEEEAQIEYGDGEEATLIREDDGWRLATNLANY